MMKITFFILLAQISFLGILCGQIMVEEEPSEYEEERYICILPNEKEILPKYKYGTNEELHKLIYAQLKYPNQGCIHGTTFLAFTVNKEGKVESPEIKRSISSELDEQLIRIIKKYEFEPGKLDGKIGRYQMVFSFKIRLE